MRLKATFLQATQKSIFDNTVDKFDWKKLKRF